MKYRTIVADPPWAYASNGRHLRSSASHRPKSGGARSGGPGARQRYGEMAMADLLALRPPADENAHLYLWTTNAFMVHAHDLARAWGFAPKTILTWTKMHHGDAERVSMKTGYWFRGATEHIVFGVRGSLPLATSEGLPTGFLWPRTPHSVKPEAFYDLVEQASPGPRLEMFARRQRLGWDTWGDEALCHVEVA